MNTSDTVMNERYIQKQKQKQMQEPRQGERCSKPFYWQKIVYYITKFPELPDLMFYVVQNQPVKMKTLVDQLKQRNHLSQTTAYRRIQWLLINDIFYYPPNEKKTQIIRIRPGLLSTLKQLQRLNISQQWINTQKKNEKKKSTGKELV